VRVGGGEPARARGERGRGWSRRVLSSRLCYLVPLLWLCWLRFDPSAGPSLSCRPGGRWTTSGDPHRGHHLPPDAHGWCCVAFSTVLTMVCACSPRIPLSATGPGSAAVPAHRAVMTGLRSPRSWCPVYGMFVAGQPDRHVLRHDPVHGHTALPIAIWLAKNFMDSVPASWRRRPDRRCVPCPGLAGVVLPLMWRGWPCGAVHLHRPVGELLRPFVLLLSNDNLPASVGIYTFFAQYAQVVYGSSRRTRCSTRCPRAALLALSRSSAARSLFGGGVKG